jgi:NACHT domain
VIEFGAFALDLIVGLLGSAIEAGVSYTALPFFERRKIARRVEDATAEVVEPLLPFLSQEGISEDKQRRLIQTCVEELRPLTKQPELLFQGSLNGQKIFEDMYAKRELPEVITDDGLKDIYTLLFPRIATLLCRIPAAVKDWESEAWSESFRRLDDITSQMRTLFSRVDQLATLPSREADETLTMVRRAMAQKIGLELDLTGLRADSPLAGKFDNFFVHPEIKEVRESDAGRERNPVSVGTPDESFELFTSSRQQAVIVGAPGAGKSTWSKWLQREALSPRWPGIAVRVELRRFSGEDLPSLQDLIREAAGRHFAEELTVERIARWLEENQVLFILDGFDEIRPSERDKVYEWLVELSTAARGCPFVLTSRLLTTDHLERLRTGWQRWSVEPFDERRIVDYIQRWYRFTPLIPDSSQREIDAASLASVWLGDPTLKHLTGNPLLLSTLLMVHHLDGSLPSGRSQLYRRYVEGMLGLWDDRRNVTATTVSLSLEQKRQILRGLALHLFLREEDQIDEPDVFVWLQGILRRMNVSLPAEDVLAALRERSGLIIGPGIYSFAHKSIAEYLVAETILQGDQQDTTGRRIDRFRLFEYRDNDRWNTVTFLWAGLAPIADVESFIDACAEAGAWKLACGILFDQYERIPLEIRRRLLLKIISDEENDLNLEVEGSWVSSRPTDMDDTELPSLNAPLRGLTARATMEKLLYRVADDGTFVWSDTSNAERGIRDVLWTIYARRPQTINEWTACLAAPSPEKGSSSAWLLWVAELTFAQAAQNQFMVDVEGAVKAYKEACPHIRGLVPIALVCAGLSIIFAPKRAYDQLNPEHVTAILEVLPGSDDNEVTPDWLLGTRDWALGLGRKYNDNIGDLLSAFIENIAKLSEQGLIERDATYERAVEFVESLKRRRETLEASPSAAN